MKKLTYEEVKRRIESVNGYRLLSKEYVNSSTKLKIQCPKRHIIWMQPNNFFSGFRCKICGVKKSADKRRLTINDMHDIAKKNGGECLSEKYIDAHTKLKWRCSCGNEWEAEPNSIRQGTWCPKCGLIKSAASSKLSYDQVKELIESESGYVLLTKDYINAKSKLLVQCNKGHIYKVTQSDFKQGKRCPICHNESLIGRNSLEEMDVKNRIISEGYEWLEGEYINQRSYLRVKCPQNHIYKVRGGNFFSGKRCPLCRNERLSEEFSHDYEYVKSAIEKEGYILSSKEYINNETKLKMLCNNGNELYMRFANFIMGNRCKCKNCISDWKKKYAKNKLKIISKKLQKHGYILLSEDYDSQKPNVKVKCPEGHETIVWWQHFKNNFECSICKNGRLFYLTSRGKFEQAFKVMKEYANKFDYEILENEYIPQRNKMFFKCPKGHEYDVSFNTFQAGHRCPLCNNYQNQSLMTGIVGDIFNETPIPEYTNDKFRYSKSGYHMRFDAALPDRKIFFEYQGEQHYKPIDFSGKGEKWAKQNLKIIQERDKEKREKCAAFGITLIEIPYKWDQSDKYIREILKKKGLKL